ncbi:MAG: CBS-domain-containing membrane protein [Chloroflexi bacterium]|jgi:CBS-domain-containing membrane protein|nr:MAG: CBS-domain-containing membrane protein [Chloroflexota bacterium]
MMRKSWRAIVGMRVHPEHARLEDPRLKGHRRVYASQAILAGAALLLALVVKDVVTSAAVFAAIASTAFVLFVTPFSVVATPRHVIGGHIICSGVGLAIAAILTISAVASAVDNGDFVFNLLAALAVALGIALMGITDTEHPPAAGTALGFAVVAPNGELVAVFAGSVIVLVLMQQILLGRLRNLL